jgi:hypothetical protein
VVLLVAASPRRVTHGGFSANRVVHPGGRRGERSEKAGKVFVQPPSYSVVILLVCCPVFTGCGGKETPADSGPVKLPAKTVVKRVPLEAKNLEGTLTGSVHFDGEPPEMETISRIKQHHDKEHCFKGSPAEARMQTWFVDDKTKAVANVVVWLAPPAGKFFVLSEADKKRSGEFVVIDQPHCAFMPHVVSLFPAYFDGAQHRETGQKLRVTNSASFPHALQWDPTQENDVVNRTLPAGAHVDLVLAPQRQPLHIGCGLHNWMHGIVWIFDHPYHAVTGAGGSFRINNIPTGVELTFHAWHESKREPFERKHMTFTKDMPAVVQLKIRQ